MQGQAKQLEVLSRKTKSKRGRNNDEDVMEDEEKEADNAPPALRARTSPTTAPVEEIEEIFTEGAGSSQEKEDSKIHVQLTEEEIEEKNLIAEAETQAKQAAKLASCNPSSAAAKGADGKPPCG